MKSCASSEVGRFGQADLVFIIGKSIDEGNRLTEIIDAFRLWANQPVALDSRLLTQKSFHHTTLVRSFQGTS
jgi:hypothetical protein